MDGPWFCGPRVTAVSTQKYVTVRGPRHGHDLRIAGLLRRSKTGSYGPRDPGHAKQSDAIRSNDGRSFHRRLTSKIVATNALVCAGPRRWSRDHGGQARRERRLG